jgi:S-DNA-T family DNA segregation ATPase FtsK/SpoIIIE
MFRYALVCVAWTAWLFVVLSCVSYHHEDNFWRGGLAKTWPFVSAHPGSSPSDYYNTPQVQNWCGAVGATVAYYTLGNIGPGFFIGLAMIAMALVVWTKGDDVTQLSLRMIGGALLVAVVSALFNLICKESVLPAGPGGSLGVAIGEFLRVRFNQVGTWLIVLLTLVVGLLLAVDEIMLALPHLLLRTWERVPTEQLAGAATGVAGSAWGRMKERVEDWNKSRRDARREAARVAKEKARADREAKIAQRAAQKLERPIPETPVIVLANAADEKIADDAPPVSVEAVAVAEAPARENAAEVTPAGPIIRKPTAATALMLGIKPPPPQKQDLGNYRLPGLDLLDDAEPGNNDGQEGRIREKAKVLEQTLASFNIEGKVEAIDTGPVVTLYELSLAPGVKSSQVGALSKDIARALMSPPVRIIDNIPGKSTMGIEVPNLNRERVRLKELMQLGSDAIERMALPMCLGKDASGNPLIEDLTKIPHLLIAGTTGSGKSVCINSIIMTMLLTQRPDHVKMIMVDPKMVEMQDYKQIPHLMAPIIDDMSKAESILEWATQKMDERYETLSEAGVRHIKDFNKLTREEIIERFQPSTPEEEAKIPFHMPYIVIIIDELADLMMTSKEVEGHIVRIAQKARAVGIHLILATQRPEAAVVTGLIKSNMPGRICFQVRSRLDSRIMLDQSGGELLLGQGDMLMLKPTGGGLIRGQAAFVDDMEIKGICKFLKEIAQPEFHPELMQLGAPAGLSEAEKDPVFDQAVEIMIETGRGSVSLLQRRLTIGYSRASRLIEQMRAAGIVGAYKGSMASEVMITMDQWHAIKAQAARDKADGIGEGGEVGHTGDATPMAGQSAGYAQQVNSTFEDEDDEDGVPNEMPGEHRG